MDASLLKRPVISVMEVDMDGHEKLNMTWLLVAVFSFTLAWYSARTFWKQGIRKSDTKTAPMLAYDLPILRHFLILTKNFDRRFDWWMEHTVKFDWKPWQLAVPGRPQIFVISDPESLEHIMKTKFHHYDKGDIVKAIMTDFLGQGIFAVDREAWKAKRRVIGKFVTERAVQGFIADVIIEHTKNLRQKLLDQLLSKVIDERSSSDAADVQNGPAGGDVGDGEDRGGGRKRYARVDLQEMFFLLTMQLFLEHAFGVECPKAKEFSRNFDRTNTLTLERFFLPPFIWKVKRLLNIGSERELRSTIITLHLSAAQIIKEAKLARESSANTEARGRASLMDILVAEHSGGQATPATQLAMQYDILNLLLAGRDTTAVTLTWTFIEMMRRPDVLLKVRQEVDAVLAPSQTIPSVEQCSQMPYLQAVLSETMRLHAPVPMLNKVCCKVDVLPCGIEIPVGASVLFNFYSVCKNPNIWGSSVKEFVPERWLDPSRSYSEFEYPVFNAGPRICIGKKLAMMEMTMVAACLVFTFDIEYDGGPDRPIDSLTYSSGILLQINGAVDVRVSLRDLINKEKS